MRALVAIGCAALLAAFVGSLFPHPRGTIVRDSMADEVEPPTKTLVATEPPASPLQDVARAASAVVEKLEDVAEQSKKQEASSPPHPAEVAEETKESAVEIATDVPPPLLMPVKDVKPDALHDTFTEARAGGARPHDAIDIMAPTGTPVVAVDDGRIAKLFTSERGGLTVYQFDASARFVYYYAHLDAYAPGLAEGQAVQRGDAIGTVGYSGNANPAAPHLHFAVMVLGEEKRWWEGRAINPYPLLIAPEGKLAGE